MIKKKESFKAYAFLSVILLISLSCYFFGFNYLAFEKFAVYKKFFEEYSFFSYIIFFCVYILNTLLFLPVTLALTILSGFIFGAIKGALLAWISGCFGAVVMYSNASRFTKSLDGKWAERIKNGINKNAFIYLTIARMIPVVPYILINISAAIFKVRFSVFLISTLIGMLPFCLFFAKIGSKL